jgi:hypothetical protein
MSCPRCPITATGECGGCPSRSAGDWLLELADELRFGSDRPDSIVQAQAADALGILARIIDRAEDAAPDTSDAQVVLDDLLAVRVTLTAERGR